MDWVNLILEWDTTKGKKYRKKLKGEIIVHILWRTDKQWFIIVEGVQEMLKKNTLYLLKYIK